MFNFAKKISLQEHFTNIALGKTKAKLKDFELSPKGSSLIHLACQYDNVDLLDQCFKLGMNETTPDFWKETPIKYALEGHAIKVLQYLNNKKKIQYSELTDSYGHPLWWGAFTSKSRDRRFEKGATYYANMYTSENYEDMMQYLKNQVDFNQIHNERNLASTLLCNKQFKSLKTLCRYQKCKGSDLSNRGSLAHGLIDNYFQGIYSQNRFINEDDEKRSMFFCVEHLIKTSNITTEIGQNLAKEIIYSKHSSTLVTKTLVNFHYHDLSNEDKLHIMDKNYKKIAA